MTRGHYISIWDEFFGYIKIFALMWFLTFLLFFIILGLGRWAFWGGAGLGFIIAFIITIIISRFTGVRDERELVEKMQFWKKG